VPYGPKNTVLNLESYTLKSKTSV